MTSRYALYEINKLRDRFNLPNGVPKGVKPHYNISPDQMVPVIINHDGINKLEMMKWGFVPTSAKNTNSIFRYKTYNARSESVFNKPTWMTAIRSQRCLVPANGFYEWKNIENKKYPYYIQPTDQTLFGFAGLYSSWTDTEGKEYGTCSIITINNESTSDMAPSRLPVIIMPEEESEWLNPKIDGMSSIYSIMKPYNLEKIKIIRVGQDIDSHKIDKPSLINKFQ
ncbi:MAG: hypothetical protein PWQ10_178 [Patescibacteria group bacterium]|nr:hypothetical protein [Patescibacteria group bacterium]